MRLAVIADDLTGAMDTGVQFAKIGISTSVITFDELANLDVNKDEISVLSVDTESRFDSPDEAYRKVFQTVLFIKRLGIVYIYKKIDSAMRGNIGKELEAIVNSTGIRILPLVPAYPANQRVTIDGKQYVEGIPVNFSKLGQDPFSPVNTADICKIIHEQSTVSAYIYKSADAKGKKKGICIYNARSDEDMRFAAETVRKRNEFTVTAGCAGFAEYLPSLLNLPRNYRAEPVREGSVLLVCGSVCEVSIEQIALLKAKGYPYITLKSNLPVNAILDRAEYHLRYSGIFIIESISSRKELTDTEFREARYEIKDRLSVLTQKIIQRTGIHTIFIIGGETFMQIIKKLGLCDIQLNCELVPGIPLGFAAKHSLQIISKSGGFGETNAVDMALSYLMGTKWIERINC